MSGKIYREVQHHATHRAMKTSRSSLSSLAYKESNEWLKGIDFRVIETYIGRNVHIHSRCNHEITSILLETAEGAISTISGEFMLIIHEWACHGKNNTTHLSPQIEHCANIVDAMTIKFGGG